MRLRQAWPLLKEATRAWSDDYAPSMGAALSYYTLFSIAPLLLIVIAVAGWFFGDAAVRGEIVSALQDLMGEEGARAVEGLLASVSKPKEGVIAAVVGVFVLIIGATSVFGELQNNLDRIWRAPAPRTVNGWWRLLRSRLLSFGMILGIAFLLMVSLVLDAVLQSLGRMWGTGPWQAFAQLLNTIVSLGLATTVFAMIYKLMPRARIAWRDVWVGAAVTAVLFTIGKFLIGLYIGRSAVASSFGAAGSLVVVMIWVYYSAQIFLQFRYPPRMGGTKAVAAAVVLAIAGGTGYWLYVDKQKRAQQRAVAALLGDTTVQLRKALNGPPPPDLVSKIDGNLKAAKAPRDPVLADAAEDYIHGAREIVRRRADAERLAREAAMSRRALAMHMAAASRRDSYWIRVATDLKKRVERDHFDLDMSLKALSELLLTLPDAQKRLAPHVDASLLLEDAERRNARDRAQEAAKRAADELEKARRLALPR